MLNIDTPVTLAISPKWLVIAQKFAAEQANATHQTQILQQTLAIFALNKYLELGNIETALTESYSWHPHTRVLTGWADLLLPKYGRLYCCLKTQKQQIGLPPIFPLNTLGIVLASLASDQQSITLQGFLPQRHLASKQTSFEAVEVQAIASVFDELFLLSEERFLVQTEIERMTTLDDELRQFFSPFLVADNLLDLVNRLNQSLETDVPHPLDMFTLEPRQQDSSLYVVSESASASYSTQPTTEKITQAIATLTEKLLSKTKILHQEFAQSM